MDQQARKADIPSIDQNGPRTLETTKARQGEAPGHVRYVLAISVVLVVVAFAVIYFVG